MVFENEGMIRESPASIERKCLLPAKQPPKLHQYLKISYEASLKSPKQHVSEGRLYCK